VIAGIFSFYFVIFFLLERQVIEPTLFIFIVTLILMYTDEKYKTGSLYCSLPVKRSVIVLARYVSLLFIILAGIGLVVLFTFLLKKVWPIGFPPPPEGWALINWFNVLFPLALIFSIFFPLYFKFGYSKGVIWGFISVAVLGFLLVGLFYVIVSIKSGSWGFAQYTAGKENLVLAFITGVMGQVVGIFGKQNLLTFLSLLIIPLVYVSIMLSVKFYSKREF
jgi:hypothetical protein